MILYRGLTLLLTKMVHIGLQFKATLENVSSVKPEGDDFRWYLKLKCLNCGEETPQWVYLCMMESLAVKGGRGHANFVSKCKLCARENSVVIIRESISPYEAVHSETFHTMVVFECRGVEPTDFSPRRGFVAKGDKTQFPEVDLTEKDWSDYDEQAKAAVGIYEVESKFVKL